MPSRSDRLTVATFATLHLVFHCLLSKIAISSSNSHSVIEMLLSVHSLSGVKSKLPWLELPWVPRKFVRLGCFRLFWYHSRSISVVSLARLTDEPFPSLRDQHDYSDIIILMMTSFLLYFWRIRESDTPKTPTTLGETKIHGTPKIFLVDSIRLSRTDGRRTDISTNSNKQTTPVSLILTVESQPTVPLLHTIGNQLALFEYNTWHALAELLVSLAYMFTCSFIHKKSTTTKTFLNGPFSWSITPPTHPTFALWRFLRSFTFCTASPCGEVLSLLLLSRFL